jgi:hypothetical protein
VLRTIESNGVVLHRATPSFFCGPYKRGYKTLGMPIIYYACSLTLSFVCPHPSIYYRLLRPFKHALISLHSATPIYTHHNSSNPSALILLIYTHPNPSNPISTYPNSSTLIITHLIPSALILTHYSHLLPFSPHLQNASLLQLSQTNVAPKSLWNIENLSQIIFYKYA